MTTTTRARLALPLLGAALLLAAGSAAQDRRDKPDGREPPATPFPVASLLFELNDTAGDLGIHAEIDGGPWTALEVESPGDRTLLSIVSRSRLRQQGLTQLAFESAEPSFDELDPADFFRRFPEGDYDIEGRLQDGGRLESTVHLSHVLAAPPGDIRVNGLPAAESCESADLPEVDAPVLIGWDPVTNSHPDLGRSGPVAISRYQLFVEVPGSKLSLDLPPDETAYEVPVAAAHRGQVIKFEIIARTVTGNNTAVESCFILR